jgi:hypothetical protein
MQGLVDEWVIEKVEYARNIEPPFVEARRVWIFDDPSWAKKLFKPGAAREQMRAKLREALVDWEKEVRKMLDKAVAELSEQLRREYWGPALDEIRRGVDRYKREIEDEVKKRGEERRNLDRELDELSKHAIGAKSELDRSKTIQERIQRLASELEG